MTILDGIIEITVRLGLESVSGINWNACPTSSESAMDEGNIFEALLEGWKHGLRNTWWVVD